MKNKIRIIVGLLLLLPLVSLAAINIYAPSEAGAWAVLYNPTDASVYNLVQFDASGVATLDTTGINGINTPWAVDLTYDFAKNWQTRVFWKNGSIYSATRIGWSSGSVLNIPAVTGQVVSRNYDASNMAKRTISVTYRGNSSAIKSLPTFNNETYELDATLLLYRPAQDVFDEVTKNPLIRSWSPDTLGGAYSYTINGVAPTTGLLMIEITNGSDFIANYLGSWNADNNTYDLYFTVADDPGDTAYWSTSDATPGGSDAGVVTDFGNGDITFTATAVDPVTLPDGIPYYVWMEQATIYDDNTDSLTIAQDYGLVLTAPDRYVIPEPAVLILILSAGGALMISHRLKLGL